ncbi:hypothetical protein FDP41_006581 [Naegleria fowleri]|uniref:Uncharacterized protein n=1 Tax=Naegleria fowleri TaxID=5763 RepID=A0A6A5BNS2_NAEFO|nr:uncharacterized protein FDP41_006581 [Naegleria fowleri]KAF0974549.1 hypothetical protein FDP41_006581 [Naegleria fowleri]
MSLYFDHEVSDHQVNRVIDVVGSRAKVVLPSNRSNVIQVFADNEEDYQSCYHDLQKDIDQGQLFILSPTNFQASEHTLMFYTPNKAKHLSCITSPLDLIYNEGMEYDQFNTTFKDKLFKLRVSLYSKEDKTMIMNKLVGFEEYRTLEQIKKETPDTIWLNVTLIPTSPRRASKLVSLFWPNV